MNEDIDNIEVQIIDTETFCIEIKEVEKVAFPQNGKECEQEIPDLLTLYNVAKI